MKLTMFVAASAVAAMSVSVEGQGSGRRAAAPILLHPGALAALVDELGGHEITLFQAKIVSVLNPQALLIESTGPLQPTPGLLNRVLVLVQGGTIRLAPRALVGASIRVTGVARTVLGMQVSREVAWPPALTDDVVRRYEIRAALLTSAVHTTDGVALVTPRLEPRPEPDDAP